MKYVLAKKTESVAGAFTFYSTPFRIGAIGGDIFSVQADADVDTPVAENFLSGVAGSKVIQDLTYTAVTRGVAGNSITVAYTTGGTAGAEVVTVTGSAISVKIQSTVSTATQVRTAINASAAAIALITCTISGTGSTAQVAAVAAALTGGVDSAVDVTANTVTITAHGLTEGLKGQLTTDGTLPAGLSISTDYFIIVVDANTIKFATSLLNAEAGTAVDLTTQGSSGATNTFTPTAVAGGGIKIQGSNNYDNVFLTGDWSDLNTATSISADGIYLTEKDRPSTDWVRVAITLTAGHISADLYQVIKGDKAE